MSKKYYFVLVIFGGNTKKTYWYLSNDLSIGNGDIVIVPIGELYSKGQVIDTGMYTEENVPYPVNKVNKIIEKYQEGKDYSKYRFVSNNCNQLIEKRKFKIIEFPNTYNSIIVSKPIEEIFKYLDLSDNLCKMLSKAFNENDIPKPDGADVDFYLEDCNSGLYADLAWFKEKVLLFREDNKDSYNKAKESNYKCYLLGEDLDIDCLVSALVRK